MYFAVSSTIANLLYLYLKIQHDDSTAYIELKAIQMRLILQFYSKMQTSAIFMKIVIKYRLVAFNFI